MGLRPAQRRPRGVRHLLLILLALLIGTALSELGLRLAWYVTQASARRSDPAATNGPLVLCHGDSNVYGIYEQEEDTYPARLQNWLDDRSPGTSLKVVNRAVPGLSTRHVLEYLRDGLDNVVCVIVTAGVNNSWSWQPESEGDRAPWYEALRIARLLRLLYGSQRAGAAPAARAEVAQGRIDVDDARGLSTIQNVDRTGAVVRFLGSGNNLDSGAMYETIVRDLTVIHDLLGAAKVQLIISTYGSEGSTYAVANAAMRDAAARLGIPLADAAGDLLALSERIGFDAVFYRDLHPKAVGYEVIARHVFNTLVKTGIAEGSPIDDPLAGIEPRTEVAPDVRFLKTSDGLTLEITSAFPGEPFAVALWGIRPHGQPLPWKSFPALWEEDSLFRLTSVDSRFSGKFDGQGLGRIILSRPETSGSLQSLSGADVEVFFATKSDNGRVGYMSPAVTATIP